MLMDDCGGDDAGEGASLTLPTDVNTYFAQMLAHGMSTRLRKCISKTILEHMRKISKYCTWLLEKLVSHVDSDAYRLPTQSEREKLRQCYDQWLELWITYSTWINEIRPVRLPKRPDTPEELLDRDGMRKVRTSLGVSIFTELCRMWFLIHYGELVQQKHHLAEQHMNVDQLDPEDVPTVHWALCHTQAEFWVDTWPQMWSRADDEAFAEARAMDPHAMRPRRASPLWNKPVMLYTQYEIYQATMLLIERINDYPSTIDGGSNEIVRFVMTLFLRLSTFFCQAAPGSVFDKTDMRHQIHPDYDQYVPNRAFVMWCTIYFYELHRRVFWLHLMTNRQWTRDDITLDDTLVQRVRAWVWDCLDQVGEEEFDDLYAKALEEHYEFPGDAQFIHYGHPDGAMSLGDTLLELRPGRQGARFFSEDRVSHNVVLASAKTAETHLDRLVLIIALDNYFATQGLAWRDRIMIDQCGIETSDYQLRRCNVPVLVFGFSRPWVSYKGNVLVTDNIYETLAAWFLLIRETCKGRVFDTDISEVVEAALTFELPTDTEEEQWQQQDDEGDVSFDTPLIESRQHSKDIGVLKLTL